MCGRFSLTTSAEALRKFFYLLEGTPLFEQPRYNIAPSQDVAAIRCDANRRRTLASLRWGLIPSWSKDASMGARMINARAETLAEKPAFRAIFKKQRCLIPADGFYEWRKDGRKKQPFHIHMRDDKPFAFAGLWDDWHGPDGAVVESCTIITTDSNSLVRPLHNRMPAILAPGDHDSWLDPGIEDPVRLSSLLRPFPAEGVEMRPVGAYVNSPKNEGKRCLEPDSPPEDGQPVDLFKSP